MNNIKEATTQKKIGIRLVFGLIFIILLLQVVPFIEILNPGFARISSQVIAYLYYIYTALMYLTFSILIYIEAQNLGEFHFDKFTLATIVLGSIVRPRLGIPGEGVFLILTGLAGITVVFTLRMKKPSVSATKLKWVLAAMAISTVMVIGTTLLELFFRGTWEIINSSRIGIVFGLIVKELTFAPLIEETLFRGFLWGYLKREGLAENKIIWIQGILFWLIHIDKIFTPFAFFIIIPLLTMICSELTLHSKQLYPAIVSHLLVNVLSAALNISTY